MPAAPVHVSRTPTARDFEVEVLRGLEEFVEQELRFQLRASAVIGRAHNGRIPVRYSGDPRRLMSLRSAVAVHSVHGFRVFRPKALLGHENFEYLLGALREVISLNPSTVFKSFRISAAGSDSTVFDRLKAGIADALTLDYSKGPAQIQVAVRRPPDGSDGWQVLVRLTPRPAAARPWRVRDYPGALNATIANVMVRLARPSGGNNFLNLCCGSGTLLAERLDYAPAELAAGIDNSRHAIQCANDNLRAAGYGNRSLLLRGDAGHAPFPQASIHEIVADLPYGMLVDTKGQIDHLYAAALSEASRIAAPGASFVAITVRKKLFESALGSVKEHWKSVRALRVIVPSVAGDISPTIYCLQRTR